jgi:hypothetical protein
MKLEWGMLDRRARAGDHAGVARLLLHASESERLAFGAAVEAGIKGSEPDLWWRAAVNPAPGYALAVIGTAPSAAKAASLLSRRHLRAMWQAIPADLFVTIALTRDVDWLGDLGTRLSRRLPGRNDWDNGEWSFTAAIMRAGGAEPTVTEGIVHGWLLDILQPYGAYGRKRGPLNVRLSEDLYLDLLLPAVFEFDGVGNDITNASWGSPDGPPTVAHHFPMAVASLVAEKRLARETVLPATIDRLVRGDKPNALRPFLQLHDELAPTADELAVHVLAYARMLTDGPGPVATMAQRALRELDDAGRLALATLLEASSVVLLRKEKALVKSQISWLEKVARREPGRAGEVLETVAVAFGHPGLAIQERALTLVGKHLPRLGPELVARLSEASVMLAGDLPGRAAGLFGGATPAVQPDGVPTPPPPVEPAPMPPPVSTAAELAEEVVALVHEESGVRWERVLAALVALHAAGERDALATALTPVLTRYPDRFEPNRWNSGSPFLCLAAAIRTVTGSPRHEPTHEHLFNAVRIARDEGRRGGLGSKLSARPDGVLALRAAEVAVQLVDSSTPMLVATPSRVNGSLDAAVLLARLSRAEADGWQPWLFDLEQALLRLPRGATPAEVTAGAAALVSPAGRQFARWLASGGLPDPISERFTQSADHDPRHSRSWDASVPRRLVATLRPPRDGGLLLERQLLTLAPFKHPIDMPAHFKGSEEVLTMVLPHHREVAAAWAAGEVASTADQDQRGSGRLLPLLADCTGPIGPAMSAALAYALGAKQESDRAAAVDAFLTLAGDSEPFATGVGTVLGDLCSDGTVKLNRVLPAVTDAHRSGATAAVWELLAATLPPLLPTKVRGVPDLLELATQVAVTLGARTEIPGLSDVATRPGASRLTREARRLQSTLTHDDPARVRRSPGVHT